MPLLIASEMQQQLNQCIRVIRNGGVIAYPTETVYGLGCDALNEQACRRISDLKGRADSKPFLLLVRNADHAASLTDQIPPVAEKLMRRFWPGPLTLIFRGSKTVPDYLKSPDGGIALRVSPHPLCREILKAVDCPLISTSANPKGLPPAMEGQIVRRYFNDKPDCILYGGPSQKKAAPSTILNVMTRPPVLIREGAISLSEIQSCIGDVHEG